MSSRTRKEKIKAGKIKKKKRQISKEMMEFRVQLSCGCCDETLYFQSEKEIRAAFSKVGLSVSADIVDATGRTVTDIDTFYGWRNKDESRRGLEFLMENL